MSRADSIRLPAEWEPHACCWMAWAVHQEWGSHVDRVKRELREVIATIAEYEPIKLLTPPDQIADAKFQSFGGNVEIIAAPVDDIWMRDIAPTFALRGDEVIAIDWNFNGWGSTPARRSRPGDRLAGLIAAEMGVPIIHAPFIAEGGALATDGAGTILTTKSCLLNENRNPRFGHSLQERMKDFERGFLQVGGRKTIWLDGDASEPVTSGHIDGYVLLTGPGAVIVEEIDSDDLSGERRAADIETLQSTTDASDHKLDITMVLPPRRKYWRYSGRSFAPCYLNAYIANGAIITGKFGDPERDDKARDILVEAFPGRDIRMLSIDHIASGGGGVRCLIQPMPQRIHSHSAQQT